MVVPIIGPKMNHAAYINRKGFHSVLLQAVCDHRKKIIDCYAGEVGSNHAFTLLKGRFRHLKMLEALIIMSSCIL